jgi:hypothetical protein
MQYLGRKLIILRELPNTAWMSKLIGKTILEEVKERIPFCYGNSK